MLRVILILILLAGGVVAYNAYQTVSTVPSPRPVVPTSPTAAASFDQKVNPVATAAASVGKKPVHLTLTENEITSKLQQAVPSGQAGSLENLQVKLGSGIATLYGTASLGGITMPLEAAARLGASQGKLTLDVISVKADKMDLPAAMLSQLLDQVKQATGLSDLKSIDLGMDVSSVQVTPGQVQIDGQTR